MLLCSVSQALRRTRHRAPPPPLPERCRRPRRAGPTAPSPGKTSPLLVLYVPAVRRLSQGMRTVGLAASPQACDAAVKPTFPLSRSCRTCGPWRLCGPEAKRFAGFSAGLSPAVALGRPASALRIAGMRRPAGSQDSALQDSLAMIG